MDVRVQRFENRDAVDHLSPVSTTACLGARPQKSPAYVCRDGKANLTDICTHDYWKDIFGMSLYYPGALTTGVSHKDARDNVTRLCVCLHLREQKSGSRPWAAKSGPGAEPDFKR